MKRSHVNYMVHYFQPESAKIVDTRKLNIITYLIIKIQVQFRTVRR